MSTAEANNDFFADFLDDYFAESDEHLAIVRRNLLALDMNVNQQRVEPSLLDELLRSFHSLKGLSGMVGVREAEQLAHEMESYLRALRSEQATLSAEGLDALIGGTKILEQVIEARRTSNPAPDIGEAIDRIDSVLPREPAASEAEDGGDLKEQEDEKISPEPLTPSPEPTLSEVQLNPSAEEKQRLGAAVGNGARAWHFEFSPMPELAGRGVNVNYIRDRLQSLGQLIHAAPRVKSSGGIVFDFLVATEVPETSFAEWSSDGLAWREYRHFDFSSQAPEQLSATASYSEEENHKENDASSSLKESSEATTFLPTATPPNSSSGRELSSDAAAMSALGEVLQSDGSPRGTNKGAAYAAPSNVVRVDLAKLDELMQVVGELVISRARLDARLHSLEGKVSASLLRPLLDVNQKMERQLRSLRYGVTRVRLVPIGEIFARMQFAVRDLARECQKKVSLTVSGQQTEIDKFVVERMMDPLLHLVRNALSHGLETEQERIECGKPPEGNLALRAYTAGERVAIEIEDDGGGVDVERVIARARLMGLLPSFAIAPPQEGERGRVSEGASGRVSEEESGRGASNDLNSSFTPHSTLHTPHSSDSTLHTPHSTLHTHSLSEEALLDILCAPGFSVRERADLTSGRGVGMAIVKNTVQELGGTVTLWTRPGVGTRFTIQLPLTLSVADALIVRAAGHTYAVPQCSIEATLEVLPSDCFRLENNEVIVYRGGVLPIVHLKRLFNLSDSRTGSSSSVFFNSLAEPGGNAASDREQNLKAKERFYAFVVGQGKNALGIAVDRLVGLREIVVRPLKDPLVRVPGISGATDLGDGRVILILDAAALTMRALSG